MLCTHKNGIWLTLLHMAWQTPEAKIAVTNFGILGNTIVELTLSKYKIQRDLVYRQLDDVPMVALFAIKEWEIECTAQYIEIFQKIDILLAADCPEYDKAF